MVSDKIQRKYTFIVRLCKMKVLVNWSSCMTGALFWTVIWRWYRVWVPLIAESIHLVLWQWKRDRGRIHLKIALQASIDCFSAYYLISRGLVSLTCVVDYICSSHGVSISQYCPFGTCTVWVAIARTKYYIGLATRGKLLSLSTQRVL